jgi:hypothetical protein
MYNSKKVLQYVQLRRFFHSSSKWFEVWKGNSGRYATIFKHILALDLKYLRMFYV